MVEIPRSRYPWREHHLHGLVAVGSLISRLPHLILVRVAARGVVNIDREVHL